MGIADDADDLDLGGTDDAAALAVGADLSRVRSNIWVAKFIGT